jgi:hypothetical protein
MSTESQVNDMNHHERFRAIMDYEPADRQPVWFFGTWDETAAR